MMRVIAGSCLAAVLGSVLTGCSTAHYRQAADQEVYGIIAQKESGTLGRTNGFTIDTPYSQRPPAEVPSVELIQERLFSGKRTLTLSEALEAAIQNSREYQLRKETLYLTALTLTRERYEFRPKFFATSRASFTRDESGERFGAVNTRAGATQLLKSGGSLGLNVANDLLRYYTGDPRRSAVSAISANLVQPLLRGAWADIATENLTQADRNVIYEVRTFARFQETFTVQVVSTYFRLLQQKDTVRNEYNNYLNLVRSRERAEALAVDRLPEFQVDQAKQDELRAKNRYILAVERYQTSLDQYKLTLGLPLGVEISLDDGALAELRELGLAPVDFEETEGVQYAVEHRLDLLNEIDRFEDSKRKIHLAANQLKPGLNLFANARLESDRPTDYARFDLNEIRTSAGVELDLPLDRLRERNTYRATLIAFERQLRSLVLALDEVRDDLRGNLRTLDQARKSYEIQQSALSLADRRVESATLLLQAGRAQIRDLLEAQNALVLAQNSFTQALIDYHLARLAVMRDAGLLKIDQDRFWLQAHSLPRPEGEAAKPPPQPASDEVIPPDKLFEK